MSKGCTKSPLPCSTFNCLKYILQKTWLVVLLFCLETAMFVVPSIPLGYTFGRIGNFINGELFGRVTSSKWGMYFPGDMTNQLRHPSQLYEAFFEGIFLFIILWSIRKKRFFDGFFLGLYIIGYGTVRFFIEYVREPDSHIGFFFGSVTLGQILCLCMILAGSGILFYRKGKKA